MRQRAAFPVTGGLLCLMAATVASAAHPGPIPLAGPALAPRTHGFMLYLSKPLGGGSGGAALQPKFGFRVDQVRMMGNSGAPDAGDPMQRRALIGWQFNGRSGAQPADMRLELGGRVSYDVAHGGFAIQSSRSAGPSAARTAAVATPSHSQAPGGEPKTVALRSLELRDDFAAAIATFKSSRPVLPQQRSRLSERPSSMQESR